MFSKIKILKTLLLAVFCAGLCLNTLYAAWWESDAIPVPPDTRKFNEETRDAAGMKISTVYYESRLSAEEIKDFYLQELGRLDWRQSAMYRYILNSQEAAQMPQTAGFLAGNLVFEKGEEMLLVNLLPQEASGEQITRFTLSQWQNKFPAERRTAMPELLKKPKKEVAPVYPGAYLVSLSESEASLRARYMSEGASVEDIAEFYKQKMSGLGWFLESEEPVQKVDMEGYKKIISGQKEDCPTCPKREKTAPAQPVILNQIDFFAGQMTFSDAKGDICQIVLSRHSLPAKAAVGPEMTIISVRYEKKTQ